MRCDPSHPCELFTLVPLNDRARAVVNDPYNSHLLSPLPNGEFGIYIGHVRSKTRGVLATIGRDGDILVQGKTYGRRHCSFEIENSEGAVMLYDHSRYNSTQVFGDYAVPFELGRTPRRVIVTPEVNTILGIGGSRCDLIQFRMIWYAQHSIGATDMNIHEPESQGRENPRLARTMDEAPTVALSRRVTRINTPGDASLLVRYIKGRQLGSGQFGTVYKALDVDSATIIAVKIIKRPQCGWEADSWNRMKREVETLARIHHVFGLYYLMILPLLTSSKPHIIDYLGAQGWAGPQVELFMGLKEGSLENLIRGDMFQENQTQIVTALFPQMLQALDCLAHENIVHRDIKPDNILYTLLPNGRYYFQLTDFGLCNLATQANTFAGSPLFMAPEVIRGTRQTSKVDTWSLFVTVAYALNAKGYREKKINTLEEAITAALAAAADQSMAKIKEMAIVDPEKRASAAQMLIKHFGGEGLSTPRGNIPDLPIFYSSLPDIWRTMKVRPGIKLRAQNRVQKRVQTTRKPPQSSHMSSCLRKQSRPSTNSRCRGP
ncbi:MAG: hypothetical protein Q9173_001901 [Seirophora scorigena]